MFGSVLLIEGSREIVSITGRLLERNGYETYAAVDFAEAKEILKEKRPQLIVMDCTLPDISGIDALKFLRKIKFPVKILLTSNDTSFEVEALNAGADDFIKKPYDMQVLLARMKRLFGS